MRVFVYEISMEKLLGRYQHFGYPLIRVGIGIMLGFHGLTKLAKGSPEWEHLGQAFTQLVGLDLPTLPLGLSAAILQAFCGLAIAVGWHTRWMAAIALPTMLAAMAILLKEGEPFSHYSHPAEISILLISFMLLGPGGMSLDNRRRENVLDQETIGLAPGQGKT